MARATASETCNRIEAVQGMILAGTPNTECLAFARKEWGISRARGYELMKRAWSQIKDDVDDKGNPRTEGKAPLFSRYIHGQLVIGIAVTFFSVLIISNLFPKPFLGIILVLAMYNSAVLFAGYPCFT
jgi:hypothetical protein